jgi:hypothetical protein
VGVCLLVFFSLRPCLPTGRFAVKKAGVSILLVINETAEKSKKLLHLHNHFTFRPAACYIRHCIIEFPEWEYFINYRLNGTGLYQPGDFLQLFSLRSHEEK